MRTLLIIACVLFVAICAACDFRSGIAKEESDKFNSSPTPTISPTAPEAPIAPADIITVDVNQQGTLITINGYQQSKPASCTKFDRVAVSGTGNKVTVKGACKQIMINGDRNEITADAAMEFILNGGGNTIKYSKYPNGKWPIVTDNGEGNVVEKAIAATVPGKQPQGKSVK